ncbi:alpha/beta hydrolase [Maricaulis sp.]|uniref:alpha/beta fold hydrolase n=1 Tax=Maricaulis sp. TaxID=1486257 RepID=UPI001B1CDD91|nr:alpha/beta hydrolase [Maricaulis sp.]MBO6798421.1 alpha/beta hydrolase [Maricaulis sp.]
MELTLTILGALLLIVMLVLIGFAGFSAYVSGKISKAMAPAGAFQEVEGGRIHYVEKGEGRPLLLIHGLGGNLHNFGYAMIDRLAERYHVIAIDRPGCGHSERDNDELARLPRQAEMIADFIRRKGIEKPLVIGHSLGGAISLRLAIDHPELVGGLAMLSPLTAVQESAPAVFGGLFAPNSALRGIIANTIAVPASIRNGAAVVETIFAPEPVPEDFRTRGGGLLSLRPVAYYAASTDMHAVPMDIGAQQDLYARISAPMGMLYGDDDAVLVADHHVAAIMAVQPELHLVRMGGVGHMPLVTQPDTCERFIDEMASRVFAT